MTGGARDVVPMTAATPSGPRDWLEELEALREKATPGPWQQSAASDGQFLYDGSWRWMGNTQRGEDAALIVAAVNALPALVGALRAVLDLADRWDSAAVNHDMRGDPQLATRYSAVARQVRRAVRRDGAGT